MKKNKDNVQNFLKKTFACTLAMFLVFVVAIQPGKYTVKAVDVVVSNEMDLVAEINSATGPVIIGIDCDINATDRINIPAGKDITITSAGTTRFTITGVNAKSVFRVEDGARLTIGDDNDPDDVGIIITHNDGDTGRGVVTYGEFVLNNGVIRDNDACENDDGDAGIGPYGGGVQVFDLGSSNAMFIMNGGEIAFNTGESIGAGVYVQFGYFEMNGGSIHNNIADKQGGGIANYFATTYIQAGAIYSNEAAQYGGGIFSSFADFTINEHPESEGGIFITIQPDMMVAVSSLIGILSQEELQPIQ